MGTRVDTVSWNSLGINLLKCQTANSCFSGGATLRHGLKLGVNHSLISTLVIKKTKNFTIFAKSRKQSHQDICLTEKYKFPNHLPKTNKRDDIRQVCNILKYNSKGNYPSIYHFVRSYQVLPSISMDHLKIWLLLHFKCKYFLDICH